MRYCVGLLVPLFALLMTKVSMTEEPPAVREEGLIRAVNDAGGRVHRDGEAKSGPITSVDFGLSDVKNDSLQHLQVSRACAASTSAARQLQTMG